MCKSLNCKLLIALTFWSAALWSQGSAVRYVDVAAQAGLSQPVTYGNTDKNLYILETTGTGVAIFDYDQDGDNDVYFANGTTLDLWREGGGPPPLLYRNDGDLRFVEAAAEAGIDRRGWGQGVCVGDVDNDGDPDLAAAYFGRNSLWINRGDGTFADRAEQAGLHAGEERWSAACTFLDYDKDGELDLFFSNYVDLDLETTPKPGENPECNWKGVAVMCGPRGLPRAVNQLFRNKGDGTFEDVSQRAGILAPGGRYGLGVVAADFDNDAWTDLYVACDMTPSLLYRNKGDGTFEEIGGEAGVAFNVDGQLQAGMGVAVADYDGNGFLDIVKSNFSGDLPSLYRNDDGAFFEDTALAAGLGANQYLGWGVLFLDADADSWPDLLLAHGHVYPEVDSSAIGESYKQPTVLYRNLGDGRFVDITSKAGPALRDPRPSRGLASGDLDGDGRPEAVIANLNAAPSLLRNVSPGGAFVVIELEGRRTNRSAIGARVTVESGDRVQVQDVAGGGSYYSQSAPELFFGLGEAKAVDRVRIEWPRSETQEFRDLDANSRYRIVEGESAVKARSE